MSTQYFRFYNGKISEKEHVIEHDKKFFFKTAPRNFLELIDILKKLSHLCNGVYVVISSNDMRILLFKRDSLELFTKLQLTTEETSLPINERLKDFLISMD